jgi:hypothetical protein
LHFRRPGITLVGLIVLNELRLLDAAQRQECCSLLVLRALARHVLPRRCDHTMLPNAQRSGGAEERRSRGARPPRLDCPLPGLPVMTEPPAPPLFRPLLLCSSVPSGTRLADAEAIEHLVEDAAVALGVAGAATSRCRRAGRACRTASQTPSSRCSL